MNVTMWYDTVIESYDTRADGDAASTKSALCIKCSTDTDGMPDAYSLVLWSRLTYDGEDGCERGYRQVVATVPADVAFDAGVDAPGTLMGFLDALAHSACQDENGDGRVFVRADVNGETIWEREP